MMLRTEPLDNEFLAALPFEAWQRLAPYLDNATLARGQSLSASGQTMSHVYFPTSATVSMMYFTDSGESSESAIVGNDGLVGIAMLMGGGTMCSHAVVHGVGQAFTVPVEVLQAEFWRCGAAMALLLRYTQSLLTQLAQRTVCNRHHNVGQQLAKSLLMSLDRNSGRREIFTTQEALASRLGVRREGVTEGALMLKRLGLIDYTRGCITVLDREGLERRSCECYAVLKHACVPLLPESGRQAKSQRRVTSALTLTRC